MSATGKHKPPVKISHDALFRVLVEDPDRATTLLRQYLPKALSKRMADAPVKLLDGTYVDTTSRVTQSDRLFAIKLTNDTPALIYTLLEHKSAADLGTPLQLLGYMVRIWSRYAEGKPDRLRNLPVIVPIVFYHGRHSWTVPQVFDEMVQADEDTAPFVPSFRYALHDLGTGEQQALSRDAPIRAILSALRYVQRNDEVTHEVLTGILRDLPDGSTLEQIVFQYIVEKYEVPLDDVTAALITAKDDGGKALMGTIAETWQKQGEAIGYKKGLAEGEARGKALMGTIAETWQKQGEAIGYKKGLAEGETLGRKKRLAEGEARGKTLMGTIAETWQKQGEALGHEKGLAEGEARGKAKSLARLLTKRFGALPEPVAAQIAAGSIEELNRWFDTAITASTLKTVFGERRDH